MYSVVNANPAYVLLAALDLISGCEIQNSSGTSVSSPNCQFFAETSVSFLQKWPLPMLVQNVSGGSGILRAFCFFDAPDNTSLFKIEESIILWIHPQSLCQVSHRTKTIRTIKFPLQLYSVHRSAGGKTGTVCPPAKIFFFGIKTCWI